MGSKFQDEQPEIQVVIQARRNLLSLALGARPIDARLLSAPEICQCPARPCLGLDEVIRLLNAGGR